MTACRHAVMFRVAAGPRLGFGHLVRCRSLARALGIEPAGVVRGSRQTQQTARSMGWSLADSNGVGALDASACELLIVDDPSAKHASVWLRRARQLGIPVASVHDLGLGLIDSDLRLNATAEPILDPAFLDVRTRRRRPVPLRVLIALGGGAHVRRFASHLAEAIVARVPDARVHAACGFTTGMRPSRPSRLRWITAPAGLGEELAAATVVVTAGGITLFEACALGVPAVALAVTPAQRRTIRLVAGTGAAIDAGAPPTSRLVLSRAAAAAAMLLTNPSARRQMASAGRRLVDGRGVFRAAAQLRRLRKEAVHAA